MAERKETHKNYLILIKIDDDDDFLLGVDWEEKASKKSKETQENTTPIRLIYIIRGKKLPNSVQDVVVVRSFVSFHIYQRYCFIARGLLLF